MLGCVCRSLCGSGGRPVDGRNETPPLEQLGDLVIPLVAQQRRGLGSQLVAAAEAAMVRVGCMKINLQLLDTNHATAAFYEALGYRVEPRISMGKLLSVNVPGADQARGTAVQPSPAAGA